MILGITGNIASGKSTVASYFAELGAQVVSADKIARKVVEPGSATLQTLVEHFGETILQADGSLSREQLGTIIFNNEAERTYLNSVTHPAIAEESIKQLKELTGAGHRLVIYEAPLLFEAGAESRVDAVLTVTIPEEIQLERLMERDRLNREEAKARIDSQMSQAQKATQANYVINNDGDLTQLSNAASKLFRELTCP